MAPSPTRRRRLPLRWYTLALTALVATAAAVPISSRLIPLVVRQRVKAGFGGADPERFERSLRTLERVGGEDAEILAAAVAALPGAGDERFLAIQARLFVLDRWRRPWVPLESSLRLAGILAGRSGQAQADSRRRAVTLLADLPDDADDARLAQALAPLARDPEPDVRYDTLLAAAELAGAATRREPYLTLIASLRDDPSPVIARHAWLHLALLGPSSGIEANWRGKEPGVSQAILYAALRTNPEHPQPALEALRDASAPMSVRAFAVHLLGLSPTAAAQDALVALVNQAPDAVTEANQLLHWRAILALPVDRGDANAPGHSALARFLSRCKSEQATRPTSVLQPLILAAVFRHPGLLLDPGVTASGSDIALAANDPLVELAMLDAAGPKSRKVSAPANRDDLLRILATRAAQSPVASVIEPAFQSPYAPLRDLACSVAARSLAEPELTALAKALMLDFNDDARRAGVVLAGLTGVRPRGQHTFGQVQRDIDLLDHLAAVKDPVLRQHIRLAQWMQKALPAKDDAAFLDEIQGMLAKDEYAKSTIVLALLHRKHPLAWEVLLNPRGNERMPLAEHFDDHRWWYVVEPYLPADAPRFSVWADREIAQFQVDLLREWCLIHRRRLEKATP